jgi:lipocalin
VDGKWTNVTGVLYNEDLSSPGKWLEAIGGGSPVNYTVISMGDDYSVEYDCGTSNGITNYCIHVLSRSGTMEQDLFNKLIEEAEQMGLNPQNLPVTITKQEGC